MGLEIDEEIKDKDFYWEKLEQIHMEEDLKQNYWMVYTSSQSVDDYKISKNYLY